MHGSSRRIARAVALMALTCGIAACVTWGAAAQEGSEDAHPTDPRMPASGPEQYAVGSDTCVACHPEVSERSGAVRHLRIVLREEEKGRYGGCEACHGRGSAHLETADPEMIFGSTDANRAWQADGCLVCHETLGRGEWLDSDHWQGGITCSSCHSVHEPESGAHMLRYDPGAGQTERDLCLTCHEDVRASLEQYSHHPVLEERLVCSDCHDPHGPSVADGEPVQSPCVECHADKESPFVFEHEAQSSDLGDGCVTCHKAHGTPNESLLRLPGNAVCIQCHTEQAAGHMGGGSCWQSGCHAGLHGSDSDPLFLE